MQTEQLIKRVQMQLEHATQVDDAMVANIIKTTLKESDQFSALRLNQKQQLYDQTFNAIRRLDILQPLIDDHRITEIMVNGTAPIFIEKDGKIEQTDLRFNDIERLSVLAQKIAANVNRTVNRATPIVDARLADGSRVNIVLAPVALNGPIITIRKFAKKQFTMADLIAKQTLSQSAADYLTLAVAQRKNIFVSGGTGSGKTTFLNVLGQLIPSHQRVITIEDSAELKLAHLPNWVRLETRNANGEGVGTIAIRDLIKTALRMRPDRIIVGEVRGDEALDMLQAMNTGHDGSLSTGHANSVPDMLARLETMVYSAKDMPLESIRQQIGSAIDIIVHVSRSKNGGRVVREIVELTDYQQGAYQLNRRYKEGDSARIEGGQAC